MTTYQGMRGTYTIIEPCRAQGGEGEIFDIRGRQNLVLKRLGSKHRTTTRHNKLRAMINTGVPQELMSQLTWPVDIVYEGGQFVGYVMPALHKTVDLNVIYSDKYDLNLEDRITIAMNLCVPVAGLHQLGQTIGDGNPENICVNPQTLLVTLVDTDSYSIADRSTGRIYPCEVGLAPYLAPEVQTAMKKQGGLRQVPSDTFNAYTDRFWLAVHIFALLMNGTHPFAVRAGQYASLSHMSASQSSVSLPQPNENICRGFFPHVMAQQGLETPVYCPQFDYLPRTVQNLFVRAFVDGHKNPSARPAPEEWFLALQTMKRSLVTCSRHKDHKYPSSASFCPWCELTSRKAPKPKPASAVQKGSLGAGGNYGGGGNGGYRGGGYGGSGRGRGGFGSCLGMLLALFLSFAVLLALPVACTANLIDIGNSEKEYKEQKAAEALEAAREAQAAREAAEAAAQAAAEAAKPVRTERTLQAADADFISISGSLSDLLEETDFFLDAARPGTYWLETTSSAIQLLIRVYDETGYCCGSYISDSDGEGTALNLDEAGRYTITVARRFADTGSFTLRVGLQKQTADLSGYTAVNDAIEFDNQANWYKYTSNYTGQHHFLLSQVAEGMKLTIRVLDGAGNTVDVSSGVTQGFGPYLDLEEGQDYYIKIVPYYGSGNYTLTVEW